MVEYQFDHAFDSSGNYMHILLITVGLYSSPLIHRNILLAYHFLKVLSPFCKRYCLLSDLRGGGGGGGSALIFVRTQF